MPTFLLATLLTFAPDLVVLENGSHLVGDITQVDTEGLTLSRDGGNLCLSWEEITRARRTDGTILVRPVRGPGRVLAWTPSPAPSSPFADSFEAAIRADGAEFLELRALIASRDLTFARWRASAEPDTALRDRIRAAIDRGEQRLAWELDVDRALRDYTKDDALVRRAVTARIARIPITESTNCLIRALRDRDAEVRAIAAEALVERSSAGTLYLAAGVLGDPAREARAAAERLMENWFSRDPALRAEILRQAPRLDGAARAGAYEYFGRTGRLDAEGLLAAAAGHDLDDRPRAAAIRALAALGLSDRRDVILQAFTHRSWRVREAAADAAGLLGMEEALSRVADLCRDDSPHVREAADRARRALDTASR